MSRGLHILASPSSSSSSSKLLVPCYSFCLFAPHISFASCFHMPAGIVVRHLTTQRGRRPNDDWRRWQHPAIIIHQACVDAATPDDNPPWGVHPFTPIMATPFLSNPSHLLICLTLQIQVSRTRQKMLRRSVRRSVHMLPVWMLVLFTNHDEHSWCLLHLGLLSKLPFLSKRI